MTEYENFRMIFDVIQALTIVALFVYTWISNKNKANQSAINLVDTRVSDLGNRTSSLETRMDHMPSDQHIQDIHEKINELAKCQAESLGEQKATTRQLEQINEHLLKGG